MQITKIESQVKNKGRYSIYIDGSFAVGISERMLLEKQLVNGLELTASDVAALKADSETDKLYGRTIDLLARRPRSRWEIQDYLKRKGAEQGEIDAITNRLEKLNLLDDLDFANRWIESRRLLKPVSKRKLTQELKAKRISDSVIHQALSLDETDDYSVLQQEVVRKRRISRYQDDQKLMQYLARQGYSYDDIKRALTSEPS